MDPEGIDHGERRPEAPPAAGVPLHTVIDSVLDYAIFTLDPAGQVTSWNAGAEQLFGWQAGEIVGRSGEFVWTPEDRAQGAPEQERKVALQKGSATDRRWHLRKDGSRFFAKGILRPMLDAAGNSIGFTKVCRDVTQERAAEEGLSQARLQMARAVEAERSRLEEIFQQSPSFIAILRGPEHVFELVNDQYYRLVGHRELLGKPVREALPEVEGQAFFELLDRVYSTGESFVGNSMLIQLQEKPGQPTRERYVDFVYQATRDAAGRVTGLYAHGVDVTERILAGLEAQRLAAIVDSSDDAIVGTDLRGVVLSWNPGAEKLFGYSAGEMLDQTIERLVPPERQGEAEEAIRRIARGDRAHHIATVRLTRSGEMLDVSITISPIRDSSGDLLGVSQVTRDISAQKRAEARLRSSEQRFRQLWATSTDAIVIIDAEQNVQYANPAVERIFGFSEDILAAEGMGVILPHHSRASHLEGFRRYMSGDPGQSAPGSAEITALHHDGHEFPIEIAFSHFQEDERDFFAAFMRDITDRKRAQEALQQSEARFRQLADSMPDIVWAARPDGFIDYYNRRWYEFTGAPEGIGGNEAWEPWVHPDDRASIHQLWAHSIENGQPYETEFRYRRASDGSYRWYLGRALPVRGADGAIVRWFGTSTDIHDHKLLQQQNEQLLESERAARAEAERASRMKDEFLATLSHELRTPLNAILGWTYLLRQSAGSSADFAHGLEVIERNARAQTQIIEGLLDMSRIISGKVRLDVQQTKLAEVVEAAIETIRPAAEAKGVRLQAVLDPDARPLSGDPHRLQQVFWNLLSNAVKYTPRGGRVNVTLELVNSHIEVAVIDSGEGIKPDFLPHVFARFRQADASTTRKHGGLGLGLAIVKQLVELHGGTIRVKSAGEDQGSSFTVALPVAPLQPESEEEGPQRRPTTADLQPLEVDACLKLKGLRIVIVDDDPDARSVLARFIEECEAEARTAASASEALALIQADPPDVVVSDIGMPGEDGYSLLRRVRALDPDHGRDVPAIALTAYARAEDRTKSLLAGFQMHLSKPVERAELLTVIARLAGRIGTEEASDSGPTRPAP